VNPDPQPWLKCKKIIKLKYKIISTSIDGENYGERSYRKDENEEKEL
jgi:hypothetical protein